MIYLSDSLTLVEDDATGSGALELIVVNNASKGKAG
jgi:hypothetical protein